MKIKNIIFYVFSLIVINWLSSCNGIITYKNINLVRGTSKLEFNDIGFSGKQLKLPITSKKFKANYSMLVNSITGTIEKDVYYYAFKNDSLLYWGYPYMFTRHENKEIQSIGEEAFPIIKDLYEFNEDE